MKCVLVLMLFSILQGITASYVKAATTLGSLFRLRSVQQEFEACSLNHLLAVTLPQIQADFQLLTENRPLELSLRENPTRLLGSLWQTIGVCQ